MRRILTFIIFCLLSGLAFAQSERLNLFHADIEVMPSGNILVREKIQYHTEIPGKRGIVRRLPLSREDQKGQSFRNEFNDLEIKRDGASSPFHTENSGDYLIIYVGESDVFLDEGDYEYEIAYEIPYQIGFFEGYDELYWNINGPDWDFPISKISSQIDLPSGAEVIQNACYTGVYGSTAQNCTSSVQGEGIYFETTGESSAGENLSVAVGFTPGIVSRPPPPSFMQRFGSQILAGIFGLILILYYSITWAKYGIDPPKPTVIPQFEPPLNLSPASLGMIHKGFFWQDLAIASLVNLARKGFIKISDETKESFFGIFKSHKFLLEELKPSTDELPKEEKEILDRLFRSKKTIRVDGKYDSTIELAMNEFSSSVKEQWRHLLWKGFNAKFWIAPILLLITYFLISIFFENYFVYKGSLVLLSLFMIGNILLFLLYQWLIRKPAKEKLKLRAEIEGFKMYLSAAEERQMQHFNPPGMTPELFEKYLPYAIALDVEGIWGEKFEKFLKTSALAPSSYQPTWYNRPIYSMGSFGHTLNSSLSNSLSASSTKPQSSGSGGSWSSGSGGGGFSGGGGGGGGGGSW